MANPLWTPSAERVETARITRFIQQVNESRSLTLDSYDALYDWSIEDPAAFWEEMWKAAEVIASRPPDATLVNPAMPGSTWFPGAELNFAENLLRYRDDHTALIFVHESGAPPVRVTYAELAEQVARMIVFLDDQGVGAGDRVAILLPNRIEAVVTMLATAAMGAIFSSCSPDFGLQGVLDRFGQIEPKVLVTSDGYTYNGKRYNIQKRVQELLLEIYAIERVVLVPVLHETPSRAGLRGALLWSEAIDRTASGPKFAQLPFDYPLYILYSSGTTAVPKCIVHGAGGTLLQHAKELMLHTDVKREDVVFYFTTCGWMTWNWLVSSLVAGATVVLYDGSPSHPNLDTLWKMTDDLGVTVFGTSPRFITACTKAGLQPGREHDLSALRTLLSTGAPLSVENFQWVYDNVKSDLQLSSICGGTDIVSCFMLGSPISPVYPGEIQKRGLAMAVEARDAAGNPVVGEKGELVCTKPFPSMPVSFWNDPDGEKYQSAYFNHYPGVWRHGDFIEITERGGVIVYGRSDATLNPGGIRIGTAEIYRQVEAMDEVVDSLVIGQRWEDDTRIVLFVVLREGIVLDEDLMGRIRTRIRTRTTPRHVPAKVLEAPDIPHTISGKKVEIAVTRIIHGEGVKNRDALANPSALDFFGDLPSLRT
ncbi:MAG: acetoacetate--CoA ligase [Deltaproteobacteria bacterium]|nr:acetoacetate--CoA ligase [Deltaproteobacteria bacterium]MBW2254765.1 acetoacetate--CoA ligase [Deltaproteobacteria bacterium]